MWRSWPSVSVKYNTRDSANFYFAYWKYTKESVCTKHLQIFPLLWFIEQYSSAAIYIAFSMTSHLEIIAIIRDHVHGLYANAVWTGVSSGFDIYGRMWEPIPCTHWGTPACRHTVGFYSAFKRRETLTHATAGMDAEHTVWCDMSQT